LGSAASSDSHEAKFEREREPLAEVGETARDARDEVTLSMSRFSLSEVGGVGLEETEPIMDEREIASSGQIRNDLQATSAPIRSTT
jgi:hypothetical protein